MAAPQLPADVQAFIDRQQECDHWTGEEPYDQERRKEIETAIDELGCAAIDKDEQALRQRYKDDKVVIKALDDSAEAPL